ncbi:putative Serralysin [uncultured Defluviicoccus sp.]|uniref:Putative Serralysin n=1 Tax=metagenome TaxID=256318 RepID=A0A380TGI5_9ZZZZ|nr:putative Serralysin [uncultured Defluviicoccus sp.]
MGKIHELGSPRGAVAVPSSLGNALVSPVKSALAQTIPVEAELKESIKAVLNDNKWGDGTTIPEGDHLKVTYSFPTDKFTYENKNELPQYHIEYLGSTELYGFENQNIFTEQQQSAATDILQLYADVADLKFVLNDPANKAAIRFANTTGTLIGAGNDGIGEGAQPNSVAELKKNEAGDVWISASYGGTKNSSQFPKPWEPGSQGHYLILHETGHALGLKHPHEDPNKDPTIDSIDKTVMSIQAFPGGAESDEPFYPTTPMPYDIAALQYIYGVNWAHNTDDTTYKFVLEPQSPEKQPVGQQFYETIWDAGGTDTIDFSAAQSPATINLNNGQFSTIDKSDGTYRVAIAFARTDDPQDDPTTPANEGRDDTIENAIGGSGNDTIRGNDAANSLTGNAGNDYLSGELGDDSLDGGNGLDKLYGGAGNDTVDGGAGNDEALGGDGNDWIEMGDGDDWARGETGNDTLDGGSGRDTLYGGGGNDLLVGQPTLDRLIGSYKDSRDPHPDGIDVFKIVADDIPPYVTGQNNTILYTFGHRLDERGYYGNGDKIDLSEFGGGGWKLIHSRDPLQPGTIKVTNHTWSVDGYATSLLVGKDKDGDYFQLFIDDGSAYGWDYRVKDFIGVTSDFPDLA